ncbi:MAG: hypothetical protein IJ468_07550 [Lachnospiraceae bacterium]|nr:hypothetical protein [Lachnospiraceae bacterium]
MAAFFAAGCFTKERNMNLNNNQALDMNRGLYFAYTLWTERRSQLQG